MRLSEAIRLGAMLKPQALCLHSMATGGTCALGAAADAIGILPAADSEPHVLGNTIRALRAEWPVLEARVASPGSSALGSALLAIQGLNDRRHWTREAIADWVEAVEGEHEPQALTPAATVDAADPVGELAELTPVHARQLLI